MNEQVQILSREGALDLIGGKTPRSHIADHFALYCEQDRISRFMMRQELFRQVMPLHGSIIECGVRTGVGLLQWYRLSRILEPYANRRIIYGFDTFAGLASITDKDGAKAIDGAQSDGEGVYADLERSICMALHNDIVVHHDQTSIIPTQIFPKVSWPQIVPIKGDFMQTGRTFLEQNQHLIVALLYLDFDLYEPTKEAIELFVPRMPKGSIIAFDELNHSDWPGETLAVMDTLGLRNLTLQRIPFEPTVSYAVL